LIFAYPNSKFKKIKIYLGVFLIIIFCFAYFAKIYLDSHPENYQKMPLLVANTIDRSLNMFEGPKSAESRISIWKISLNAIKEKPILGWGPENFIIAFDKYYNPSLPKIGELEPEGYSREWFDRAHNFIFEITVTAGIITLLIYFYFFGYLIWQLQKTKRKNPKISLICHGLQATFLAYFTTLLVSFDSVSTYIISFLLIGYSLYLIEQSNLISFKEEKKLDKISYKLYKLRYTIIIIILLITLQFIYNYNLKPLYLNKEINLALLYANSWQEKECEKALNIINKIHLLKSNGIIDNYLRQKKASIIYRCLTKIKNEKSEDLLRQNIQLLEKNIEKNPKHVLNFILAGEYINILIKEKNKLTENIFIETEENLKLKEQSDYFFKKALELSPKRQLILKDWADTQTITGQYLKAEKNLEKCINLNPFYCRCSWYMALNKGYQKDYQEFEYYSKIAKENNCKIESIESLQEVVNMYIRNNDYNGLIETYPKLIPITADPLEKAQLYASLATSYKEIEEMEKAREQVLKILELIPSLPKNIQQKIEEDVKQFLKILK
ncbi:MAG: O-antigen ligase family protein, partial [Candidatus Nealsonbacteria bacterium]